MSSAFSLLIIFVWLLLVVPLQFVITTIYESPEIVSEQEIISLSNSLDVDGHGGSFYVSVNSENVYSYRVETVSEVTVGETTYELHTVGADERVLEVETTDGSMPRLVKYNENGKISFWSMGFDRETYVFYVSEDSISKDIELS